MRLKPLAFTLILLIVFSNFARANSIFLKSDDKRQISISSGSYDDIRLDGKISYWLLKNKNISIEVYGTKAAFSKIVINKFENMKRTRFSYIRKGNYFVLYSASLRSAKIFNYTLFSNFKPEMCSSISDAKQAMSTLGESIKDRTLMDSFDNGVIDSSCHDTFKGEEYNSLAEGALNALRIPTGTKDTKLTKCLQNNNEIISAFKDDAVKDQLKILAGRLQLESAKVYQGSPQTRPLISCKSTNASSPKGTCSEADGKITLFKTSDPQKLSEVAAEYEFSHEILHKAGVTSDETVNLILNVCLNGNKVEIPTSEPQNMKIQTFQNVLTDVSDSTKDIAAGTKPTITPDTAANAPSSKPSSENSAKPEIDPKVASNVPKEVPVADLKLPTSAEMQTVASNPSTDEGAERASQQSAQQSNGLFKFANQVGAASETPAQATFTPTLASNASGFSSPGVKTRNSEVSGGPSTTQAPTYVASTRTPASNSDTNERVVQEINVRPSSNVPTNSPGSAGINAESIAKNAATATGAMAVANQASANDYRNATLGIKTGEQSGGAPAGSTAPRNANANRAPSSAPAAADSRATPRQASSNASSSSARTPDQTELMSFFLSGNYKSVRQRLLSDSTMRRNLQVNSITVIDTKGNSYGAERGQVILLDKGDQFVRQR